VRGRHLNRGRLRGVLWGVIRRSRGVSGGGRGQLSRRDGSFTATPAQDHPHVCDGHHQRALQRRPRDSWPSRQRQRHRVPAHLDTPTVEQGPVDSSEFLAPNTPGHAQHRRSGQRVRGLGPRPGHRWRHLAPASADHRSGGPSRVLRQGHRRRRLSLRGRPALAVRGPPGGYLPVGARVSSPVPHRWPMTADTLQRLDTHPALAAHDLEVLSVYRIAVEQPSPTPHDTERRGRTEAAPSGRSDRPGARQAGCSTAPGRGRSHGASRTRR
jgi:hypothetical protein